MARECLERGTCISSGMPTSGLGLAHGASWIRVIAYSLAFGNGLRTVQLTGLIFLLGATIAWSIVAWRALSWRAAMFAALLALPTTMATLRYDDLTNGVLAPLPMALYYACTAWFVQSRRLVAALGASLCLAVTISAALGLIILVPFHVALVALGARRPLAAATGAALAVVAPFALESSDAAVRIVHRMAWPGLVVGALLLVVGIVAAVSAPARSRIAHIAEWVQRWRRQFLDLSAPIRLRAAMKLATTYLIIGPWVGWAIAGNRRIPAAHYFAAAVLPLVFLAADAAGSMSRRALATLIGLLLVGLATLPLAPLATGLGGVYCTVAAGVAFVALLRQVFRSGARLDGDLATRPSARFAVAGTLLACLICAPDALIYPRTPQVWPVATAETMVARLYASGLTFPELMHALQGQAPYTIQSLIASLDPALFQEPPPRRDSRLSLIAMMVDPALAARTHDVLARLDTPSRNEALAVRSTSVLDRSRLRTCYAESCDQDVDPARCITRDPKGAVQHDRPYFSVDKTEAPVPDRLLSYQPQGGTYCVRFFIPLRLTGTGEPHWVRVSDIWPLRIRIRQVDGATFDGTLPGPEVRLANETPGSGTLEVEVSSDGVGPESDWLEEPPVIEVTSENAHLLEPFRQGRITLH